MKLAVDEISQSRSTRGFSVDNESNGRWERKLKRKGEKKRRWGEKAIVEWNNRSLADLYRAKLKILFRLRSFTARRTGFDEGHLNRSTNIDSIRSMDARLRTQTNEWLLGIYQVERVSPEWNVSFVKRGQYCSESQWLGRSPFFSQLLRFKQMESEIRPTGNSVGLLPSVAVILRKRR